MQITIDNVKEWSFTGGLVGCGIAVIPAAVTTLIAGYKIILINIIANTALFILTAGQVTIEISGISLLKVPVLWRISRISAVVGGTIAAVCFVTLAITLLVERRRQRC